MKSLILDITQRIVEKSKPTRGAYLARLEFMKNRTRGADRMGCANVAHAIAALPSNDKLKIVISGLTLKRTCHKCPKALLIYKVLPSSNYFPAKISLY